MIKMPKGDMYIGLQNYLKDSGKVNLSLTFKEIESIVGFSLPASARKHKPSDFIRYSQNTASSTLLHP
jgi:hypothetical protein